MPADLSHLPLHNASARRERSGSNRTFVAKCGSRVFWGQLERFDNKPGCAACSRIQGIERHADEKGMKLEWSDYKSTNGSLSFRFGGGFCVYVLSNDESWQPTNRWRVWLGSEKKYEIPGLCDRWFSTRRAAMQAAEAIFVPIAHFAHELCEVPRIKLNTDRVWSARLTKKGD